MNHMEDEIKKRFENANSLDGIAPDDLWGDISGALDASRPANEEGRRLPFFWWFAGLFLMGSFAFLLIWTNNKKDGEIVKEKSELLIALMEEKGGGLEDEIKSNDSSKEEEINVEEVKNKSNENESENVLKIDSNKNAEPTSDFILNENNSSERSIVKNEINNSDKDAPVLIEENKEKGIAQIKISEPIDVLPFPFLELTVAEPKLNTAQVSEFIDTVPIEILELAALVKNKKWRLGFTAGGNYLSTQFNGQGGTPNFDGKLNDTHRGQIGNSWAIYGEWQLNGKLYLSTGLEYFITRTQFDIVQEWDTVMWRDNMPGGELINARATRTVVHHNRQDYISIPLMLGISKNMGRFRAGIGGGGAVNFFVSQKGRTLSAEETITDIGGANLPFRKTFFSFQLQPQLHYRLTNTWEIGVQSMLRWQPHGQSGFYGLRQNTFLAGLNFGVFFRI